MSRFGVLYGTEVKKTLRGKTLIILTIIILLFIAILALTFEVLIGSNIGNLGSPSEMVFESPQQGLLYYEGQIEAYDVINNGEEFWNSGRQVLVRMKNYYQYLIDNEMLLTEANPYTGAPGFSQIFTGTGFVTTIMQAVQQLAVLAIIVFSASNLIGEQKSGRLKMQLLRPVSRASMFSAKWSAAMTGGLVIYGGATIVAMVYSLIRFGSYMRPEVMFFTDNTPFLVSSGGLFILQFISGILPMLFFGQLTYAIGQLTKSKNAAMAIPIILTFMGSLISMVLGFVYIGYIDPLYNLNFLQSMAVSSSIYKGTNVLGCLAIVSAYMALMFSYNYKHFRNMDIN